MHDQFNSSSDMHHRLGETQDHIDALHSTLIVVLASLENAGIRLVDTPGALRNFFARVRIPLRLATDPTRPLPPGAPGATNGAAEMNRHVLAKAV